MIENKYFLFTEVNDWEGETWNFYINLSLNEKYLDLFKKLSEKLNACELNQNEFSGKNYEFDFNPVTQNDFIQEESDHEEDEFEDCEFENSYMDEVNVIEQEVDVEKLEHILTLEEEKLFDSLYKGRIMDLFKVEK